MIITNILTPLFRPPMAYGPGIAYPIYGQTGSLPRPLYPGPRPHEVKKNELSHLSRNFYHRITLWSQSCNVLDRFSFIADN